MAKSNQPDPFKPSGKVRRSILGAYPALPEVEEEHELHTTKSILDATTENDFLQLVTQNPRTAFAVWTTICNEHNKLLEIDDNHEQLAAEYEKQVQDLKEQLLTTQRVRAAERPAERYERMTTATPTPTPAPNIRNHPTTERVEPVNYGQIGLKLPKPDRLTGEPDSKVTIEDWTLQIEDRLENAVGGTDRAKVMYVREWVETGSRAWAFVQAYCDTRHRNEWTAEGLLQFLTERLVDKNQRTKWRQEFINLRMSAVGTFDEFYATFSTLAARLGFRDEDQREDLFRKVHVKLANASAMQTFKNINDMATFLSSTDANFSRINAAFPKTNTTYVAPAKRATTSAKSTSVVTSAAATKPTTTPAPASKTTAPPPYRRNDTDNDQLKKEGRCFTCREQGHLSRDCPVKKEPTISPAPRQVEENETREESKNE